MNTHSNDSKVLDVLNIKKVIFPLLIGIIGVIYILYKDPNFGIENLRLINSCNPLGLLYTLLVLLIRDGFYTYRVRLLTNNTINWFECFRIIVLWEFSSAVTPSAVGGTFVAVFLFMHVGVSFGKALAYVMTTAIFDNLFFIIMAPVGYKNVFSNPQFLADHNQLFYLFWLSYVLILSYTVFMSIALFIKPSLIKWIMIKVTSFKLFRKFNASAIQQGDNLILASQNLKGYSISHWIKLFLITFIIWICRYGILNSVIYGFIDTDIATNISIFCQHIVMWVTMLICPTPGGSGFAEYSFNSIYGPLLNEYTIIVVLIWRIITYYIYLIAGIIILPGWIKTLKFKNSSDLK